MRWILVSLEVGMLLVALPSLAISQPLHDGITIWQRAVGDWEDIAREIGRQEFTCQQTDVISNHQTYVTVAFQGPRKKLELRDANGRLYFVAGINGDYDFGLDSNDDESEPNLFIADLNSPDAPSDGNRERMWESQSGFFANVAYSSTFLRNYTINYDAESVQINEAIQLDNGNIRLKGTAKAPELFEFDLELVPARQHAVVNRILTFPKFVDEEVITLSPHLKGVFPSEVKQYVKDLRGKICEGEVTAFGTPSRCNLPKEAFELESYGIATPDLLTNKPHRGLSTWQAALIATTTLLLTLTAVKYLGK